MNKILNVDKYRDEINKWLETEKPLCNLRHALGKAKCPDMLCWECREDTFKWLCKEYEPRLLKNGDELKPGDWIMVKIIKDGEWAKRQFAFFHDGWFYCLRGGSNFAQLHLYPLLRYEQARLPEEGE